MHTLTWWLASFMLDGVASSSSVFCVSSIFEGPSRSHRSPLLLSQAFRSALLQCLHAFSASFQVLVCFSFLSGGFVFVGVVRLLAISCKNYWCDSHEHLTEMSTGGDPELSRMTGGSLFSLFASYPRHSPNTHLFQCGKPKPTFSSALAWTSRKM